MSWELPLTRHKTYVIIVYFTWDYFHLGHAKNSIPVLKRFPWFITHILSGFCQDVPLEGSMYTPHPWQFLGSTEDGGDAGNAALQYDHQYPPWLSIPSVKYKSVSNETWHWLEMCFPDPCWEACLLKILEKIRGEFLLFSIDSFTKQDIKWSGF